VSHQTEIRKEIMRDLQIGDFQLAKCF